MSIVSKKEKHEQLMQIEYSLHRSGRETDVAVVSQKTGDKCGSNVFEY